MLSETIDELLDKRTRKNSPTTEYIGYCPLCEGNDSFPLFTVPDRLHHTPGQFTYRRCNDCRTVYQDPRVVAEDLWLCYPKEYGTHQVFNDLGDEIKESANTNITQPIIKLRDIRDKVRIAIRAEVQDDSLKDIWGLVGKYLAKSKRLRERAFNGLVSDDFLPRTPRYPKALDIGCGNGRFTKELMKVWQVEGVEWDVISAEIASRNTGCRIWVGDFREIDLPKGGYGLVFLHHVFEHLDDPILSLRRVWELLAPGGRVILVYPNHESLGSKIFRDSWFPWEAPRHLVFPSTDMLIRKSNEIGFKLLKCRTSAKDAAYYFALSRDYRDGKAVDEFRPDITLSDRGLYFIEKLLTMFQLRVGEETTIVLAKQNT